MRTKIINALIVEAAGKKARPKIPAHAALIRNSLDCKGTSRGRRV
jgi:hypothetical protein